MELGSQYLPLLYGSYSTQIPMRSICQIKKIDSLPFSSFWEEGWGCLENSIKLFVLLQSVWAVSSFFSSNNIIGDELSSFGSAALISCEFSNGNFSKIELSGFVVLRGYDSRYGKLDGSTDRSTRVDIFFWPGSTWANPSPPLQCWQIGSKNRFNRFKPRLNRQLRKGHKTR